MLALKLDSMFVDSRSIARLNRVNPRASFVFAAEPGEELIHKIIRHFRHGVLPVSLFKFYIKVRSGASRYLMYGLRVFWFFHQDAPKREISYPINFS